MMQRALQVKKRCAGIKHRIREGVPLVIPCFMVFFVCGAAVPGALHRIQGVTRAAGPPPLQDCNANGIPDDVDLGQGTSFDCNGDGRPDECGVFNSCQMEKLSPPSPPNSPFFGYSVAISGDWVVVGTPNGDQNVHLFRLIGQEWLHQGILTAPEEFHADFGLSVSISGNVVIVGDDGAACATGACGAAYVYRFNGTSWIFEDRLEASDAEHNAYFGNAVAVDGSVAIVGAFRKPLVSSPASPCPGLQCGAAYMFRFNGMMWEQEAKLMPSDVAPGDWFGYAVSIKGDTALIGSYFADCPAGDGCGAAYIYHFDGVQWGGEVKLTPSETSPSAHFGESGSLANNLAVVGAPLDGSCPRELRCGAAYVFRNTAGTWSEEARLIIPELQEYDAFGRSVSVRGGTVVVGATGVDCPAGEACGALYIFRQKDAIWMEESKLGAEDAIVGDALGYSAALDGDYCVGGSPANGNPSIGAAYIFALSGTDCNCNASPDLCDIIHEGSFDSNTNLVPDECEVPYGDVFPLGGDFVVDIDDLLYVLDGFVNPPSFPAADLFPCNGNGEVDVDDILAILDAFIGNPACVWGNGQWVPS